MLKDSIKEVYQIKRPLLPSPIVFDSPHSGRIYPNNFDFSCPFDILTSAEDNHVEDLFEAVPSYGGYLLYALFPRTYIDVNRSLQDIDQELIDEPWPLEIKPTSRSHSGIGLIRRLLKPGILVYDRKLKVREVEARIELYYKTYHTALESLLNDLHYQFGQVWHINCHSMPEDISAKPNLDFVLGDRDGTTCDLHFTHAIRDYLSNRGYIVSINHPYKGVELIDRYSKPSTGRHSLQIEINKSLYWDEKKGNKTPHYKDFKNEIEALIIFCINFVNSKLVNLAAD